MKLTNFFLGLSLLVALMLTSCTPAGADLGMVGKWKNKNGDTMEIKADDTIAWKSDSISLSGKITKADSAAKTISYEVTVLGVTIETDTTYELTCTTLKFGNAEEYTKQ